MRRKSTAVYFAPDERTCVKRAATATRTSASEFVRDSALLRAGYRHYQGPLFEAQAPIADRDRLPHLVIHELLRLVYTMSRHIRKCFAERIPEAMPSETTLGMLLMLAQQAAAYTDVHAAQALAKNDQLYDWARRTALNAQAIAESNPILGTEVAHCMLRITLKLGGNYGDHGGQSSSVAGNRLGQSHAASGTGRAGRRAGGKPKLRSIDGGK